MAYEKLISEGPLSYHYMRVKLEFPDDVDTSLTKSQFTFAIQNALKALYGEVGKASVVFDVLKYQAQSKYAVIRVISSGFGQLWSALTLYGKHDGEDCAFRVFQVSAHLMGIAVNSRTYQHQMAS